MPFSHKSDAAIYYEVHGDHPETLLLIHGLGASKHKWPPKFISLLSQHYRVVIFDNRGTGQSDKPEAAFTLSLCVEDAIGILDTLKIERAYIGGVSMGGAIAQHVALNHPGRVQGLILMSAGFGGSGNPHSVNPSAETINVLITPSSGDEMEDLRNLWSIMYAENYLTNHRDELEQDLQGYLSVSYPATPARCRQQQLQMLNEHDTYDQLGDINCEVLVLAGSEDLIIPAENARIMAQRIPHSRLVEYEQAGHLFYVQNPQQVVADICGFTSE